VVDENVPQALAGYRPRLSATVVGEVASSITTRSPAAAGSGAGPSYSTIAGYNSPVQAGGTITQTLFNGFQTANRTRQAET
jgi:outer membrane protein